MADFYQMGVIATLHRLGAGDVGILERQLEYFSRQQPIALVLPALYSEFEKPAMDTMIAELSQATYVRQFVLSWRRPRRDQFEDGPASSECPPWGRARPVARRTSRTTPVQNT